MPLALQGVVVEQARRVLSSTPLGSLTLDAVIQEPGIGTREYMCSRRYSYRVMGRRVPTPWLLYRDEKLVDRGFGEEYEAVIHETGTYTVSLVPLETAKLLDMLGIRLWDRFRARVYRDLEITVTARLLPVDVCVPVPLRDPVELVASIMDNRFTAPGEVVLPTGYLRVRVEYRGPYYGFVVGKPPYYAVLRYIPKYYEGNRVPLFVDVKPIEDPSKGAVLELAVPTPPVICDSDALLLYMYDSRGEMVEAYVVYKAVFYYNEEWIGETHGGGGFGGSFIKGHAIPRLSRLPRLSIPGAVPVFDDSPLEIPVSISVRTTGEREYRVYPEVVVRAEGLEVRRSLRRTSCRVRFTVDGVEIRE